MIYKKLHFIEDEKLKRRIVESFRYMILTFNGIEVFNLNGSNKNESYRVVVLYAISIIEAILLYVLQHQKQQITTMIYKYPNEISKYVKHINHLDGKLVTAVQIKKTKTMKQIGIYDLVTFFKNQKLMTEKTANDILETNSIRNTFHLLKEHDEDKIKVKDLNKAFLLLEKVLKGAPLAI